MEGSYRAVEMAHAHKPMPAINPPHSKTRAKVSLAGGRRTTEIAIAVHALNRMLELGRPKSVRIA
jgi:hypothetical protein